MLSLYEILKASKTGIAPDMWTALAGMNWGGAGSGAVTKEITGIPPLSIRSNGTMLLDYLISGNMYQASGVSPTTPIQPQSCGERTVNLFNVNRTISTSFTVDESKYIDGALPNSTGVVSSNTDITIVNGVLKVSSNAGGYGAGFVIPVKPSTTYLVSFKTNKSTTGSKIAFNTMPTATTFDTARTSGNNTFTIETNNNTQYIILNFRYPPADGEVEYSNIMVVEGLTAPSSYIPYGYKLTISSANTTTPIYLGEVETTRKVKKLVLTGEETGWTNVGGNAPYRLAINGIVTSLSTLSIEWYCSHYLSLATNDSWSSYDYCISRISTTAQSLQFRDTNQATLANFKAYLAQQYAAGTPVTVWYVLATPETAVVNEPLRKIGDYADTLSYEQAGVQIPTLHGNTVIDVLTELKPSQMYIKYQE